MLHKFFRRKTKEDAVFTVVVAVVLLLLTAFFLLPLFVVFTHAFLSEKELLARAGTFIALPRSWDFTALKLLLAPGSSVYRAYGVTLLRVVVGTVVQLLFTCTMAYALSKEQLPGRKLIIGMINVAIVLPAPLVPLFLLVRSLGLYNNFWALILPFAINSVYIFIMKAFYQQLPAGLEEAAMIDGCSQFQLFRKIVLPLSLPSIATVGMMYAVWHWNEWYYASLFLADNAKLPLQNIMKGIIQSASASDLAIVTAKLPPVETVKCAVILVSVVPILCVYPFLQKYFAKGLLLGSVKG